MERGSQSIFPLPDDLGGVLLCRMNARVMTAPDDTVRYVDAAGNPFLETLDLRLCQTPLHLAVRECPALRRILLPETRAGAIVHLDLGDGRHPMSVTGSIAHLDCCRADGQTAAMTAAGAPFDGAWLGPMSNDAGKPALWVALDPPAAAVDQLVLPAGLRAAIIAHQSGATSVRHTGAALQQLALLHCSDLRTVSLGGHLQTLEVVGCRSLAEVVASGESVRIMRAADDNLVVRGSWRHGHFVDIDGRVDAPLLDAITSERCLSLVPTHLSLANASDPTACLPSPDALADPVWRDALMTWCRNVTRPNAMLPALRMLAALADSGVAAADVWQVRNDLKGRTRRMAPIRGPAHPWLWPQVGDLGQELYDADLALWLRLRDDAPDTAAFETDVRVALRAVHFLALARAAARSTGTRRRLCLEILSNALAEVKAAHLKRVLPREDAEAQRPVLARLIETLIALRAEPVMPYLAADLAVAVRRLARESSRLPVLAALAALGCEAARGQLGQSARQCPEPDMAARFRAAAMAPPRSEILSITPIGDRCHA